MNRFAFGLVVAVGLLGIADGDGGGARATGLPGVVSGSITYRLRIALTPAAVVEVTLAGVSRADAPAVVIGQQVIADPGQVPIFFEIASDPAMTDERPEYAVQVRITDGGRLAFVTTRRYAVLTRGNPAQLEIIVDAVGG